jgi:uncharacterized membrane protein YkvA (DUF1232 family)
MNWIATALLVGIALFFYLRSPIDLLPDAMGLVGLLDDLLLLIVAVWWIRKQSRVRIAGGARRGSRRSPGHDAGAGARSPGGEDARPQHDADEAPWDPYTVLGVRHGASGDEITRAYREQMKLYHPDRVADLGAELKELAHRKALDIQRAYEEIGKPRG